MKILQLGKFYPIFGGIEKVEWDLTKGLSEKGIDCDMLCAGLKAETTVPQTIRFNDHGRVIVVPAFRKAAGTMLSFAMPRYLRKYSSEYDIIQVHHPDPMAALSLWLSGYKGKVILHWHSDIIKQKKLLKFYMPLQNWLIKRADIIVGTSPVYVQQSPYLAKVQDKITAIPIGVDPVEVDAEAAEKVQASYPGKKIVFSLGRLVPYKGYTYLIKAASMLPDDYHVVIGGNGPLMGELEKQIIDSDLKDKVSLLGRVPDDTLAGLYGAARLFVLPSVQKTEAFGIVLIEAMSCGLPIVATKIPESGTSWVNADGESGLNVPIEDAEALADAIKDICENEDKHIAFSIGSAKRYAEVFTKSKMIDNFARLYEKI